MRKLLLILSLSCVALMARADALTDLYDVMLPVEEQSQRVLADAAAAGLEQVLIRVTGRRDVADNPVVARALASAQPYLSQYRYEVKQEEGGPQRYISIRYMDTRVIQLLRDAQLPVWSANRPRVLVWLVADDMDGRQFVTSGSHQELVKGLAQVARERGILLSFPLLDLEDNLSLSHSQVWAMDLSAVRAASQRYRVNHMLVGRLSQLTGGDWLGSWAYVSDAPTVYVDTHGNDAAEVAKLPIQRLADEMAARYAVLLGSEEAESAYVHITGVEHFNQYARLLSYLEGVAVIENVNVAWVGDGELVIQLLLDGDMARAHQLITADNRLVESRPPAQRDLLMVAPTPDADEAPIGVVAPAAADEPRGFPLRNVRWYYRWNGW